MTCCETALISYLSYLSLGGLAPDISLRTPTPKARSTGACALANPLSEVHPRSAAALGGGERLTCPSRPFFKASETFHVPGPRNQETNKLYYDAEAAGTGGPVQVGYAAEYSSSHRLWHDTMNALGVRTNTAHMAGSNTGVWTNLGSVDPQSSTRSYSATAYLAPAAARPNLTVLTEALVTELVLDGADGDWTATGAAFEHGGKAFVASASREVVVCAGSVQSPLILELSGIGSPGVLAAAGVPVRVDSPNVGENLQDHISSSSRFPLVRSSAFLTSFQWPR